MEGKFIVFEGISGCGKGTQARRTLQYLQEADEYNHILITPEPTRSDYGMQVRALMREHRAQGEDPHAHARKYLDLFIKDRLAHQPLIEENLRKGVQVLGVRYYHSTIVHQQSATLSAEEIIDTHRKAGIRFPDLTIILDVPPEEVLERIASRSTMGVFETKKRLELSRERYLQLLSLLPEQKIVVVSAVGSVDDVFSSYKAELNHLLSYTQ